MSIDLHIHSTASDGSFTPHEILMLARQQNLRAIAITDHDTLDGVREALRCEMPPSLQFVPGVEISTKAPSGIPLSGSVHILGYGIDVDDKLLGDHLRQLQDSRANRNPEIIGRLKDCGMDVTYEELTDTFQGVQIGRPHIAQLLMKKGYVASINEAFDRYLGTGKDAYVDKYRIDCLIAINVIKNAGGISVLAHPGLFNMSRGSLASFLEYLKDSGLKGLEVYYPEHTPEQTVYLESLADALELLVTGGTDFHGAVVPDIQLGIGTGNFHVPDSVYENMRQALGDGD